MKLSIRRLEQVAKLLAEEIKEQLAEKQGINEMEQIMRELVKGAVGLGMQQVLEQREERYARKEVECGVNNEFFVESHLQDKIANTRYRLLRKG